MVLGVFNLEVAILFRLKDATAEAAIVIATAFFLSFSVSVMCFPQKCLSEVTGKVRKGKVRLDPT